MGLDPPPHHLDGPSRQEKKQSNIFLDGPSRQEKKQSNIFLDGPSRQEKKQSNIFFDTAPACRNERVKFSAFPL